MKYLNLLAPVFAVCAILAIGTVFAVRTVGADERRKPLGFRTHKTVGNCNSIG